MNAYEIARAEATRVVEAAYHKAVAAGELPEGSMFIQDLIGLPVLMALIWAGMYGIPAVLRRLCGGRR